MLPGTGRVAVPVEPAIEIWDIDPVLNAGFFDLFAAQLTGSPFDAAAFRTAAFAYFARISAAAESPDPFFDNFGPLALPWPATRVGFTRLWEWALQLIRDWEVISGKRLHKGSGYYFAGVRDIELGDLDRGFLYMHQAAEEDALTLRSSMPPTPATWFITLDARNLNQAYHAKVKRYEDGLRQRLASYRRHRRGILTIDSLRDRYSRHPLALSDVSITVTYVLAQLDRLSPRHARDLRNNRFAALLLSNVAFELCLVIEELLAASLGRGKTFEPLAAKFAPAAGMSLTDPELRALNKLYRSSFDGTIAALLAGRTVPGFSRLLARDEADLAITYGIRNRVAHGLDRPSTSTRRFDRIMTRLFYTFFRSIETLYP